MIALHQLPMVRIFLLLLAALISGCASEVGRTPASFSPDRSTESARIQIEQEQTIFPSSGYSRVLPMGSIWELRGTLPQGRAYKRLNGIFTVEGAHVHEAYIVVKGNQLVGFYLPVEEAFSATTPVTLRLK